MGNASRILDRLIGDDADLRRRVSQKVQDSRVGAEVYRIRTAAGLTQAQLARRIGTAQSVIARIEDADYDGHSVKLLARIAEALDLELRIRFVGAVKRSGSSKGRARTESAKKRRGSTGTARR